MNKKTYILAEMASSHEGDKKLADSIIESASRAGADGILLQIFDLNQNIIPSDPDYKEAESIYLNQKIWESLIKKAQSLHLDVWANVYDIKSFEFIKNKKIKGLKLHSSNLENRELLKRVSLLGKDLLLSIGGLEKREIDEIIKYIFSFNDNCRIYLMYGLQNFPTKAKDINLNFIINLANNFSLPWGYQDHSEPESADSINLPILAQAMGAHIIEKHLTYNRSLKGQDYEAALNPDEFVEFAKTIKDIDYILNKEPNEISTGEVRYKEYKNLMKVVSSKAIKQGEKFTKDNLAVMRSKKGEIQGRHLDLLLEKESNNNYAKFEPLKTAELLKIGIFITVRLKSGRLPMKALKLIAGKPMIGWMIERLKKAGVELIVVMTSVNPQDDPLVEIAKKNGIEYFRGSEEDVLARMRDCARKFGTELVISVTGDDPLKEPLFIKKMIEKYIETKFDFCEIEGLPNGCESYSVSKKALEKVCEIKGDRDTEIWGDYFKKAGIFKCELIRVEDPTIFRPNYRVTVDTPEDFEVVSKIFENLLKEKEYFNVYDICKFLDENPKLVKVNSVVKQRTKSAINFKQK